MKNINRRKFIGQASCSGLGYLTLMNSFLNLKAINAATISNNSIASGTGYKAIICILKAGGNDSFNMLMPYDIPRHNVYTDTRDGLALSRQDILQLNLAVPDPRSSTYHYACHPSMTKVRDLFNDNKLSFLSNVGTILNNHTTKQDYYNGTDLPIGLFSHSDQIQQWQTGIPSERGSKGWGGKMADIISSCNANQNISMNVSLSGTNIFQTGNSTIEYAIDPFLGSIGINGYDPNSSHFLNRIRSEAIDSLIGQQYTDIFKDTYVNVLKNAVDAHEEFGSALANATVFGDDVFPDSFLGAQLEMIARVISVRQTLGFSRQIFYIVAGGWDHHDEVLMSQDNMLGDVSDSLSGLMTGLEQLGVENDVLTMTISEFGRTLTSNGNGSDHAWGGNVMVMGGTNLINGGRIYGEYPSLELDTNIEIGGGVLIPGLSTDEYFAEVAKWFGVSPIDLDLIFPNLSEFYSSSSSNPPIGFIQ